MTPSHIDHAASGLLMSLAEVAMRTIVLAALASGVLAICRVKCASVQSAVWTIVLGAALLMLALHQLPPIVRVPVPVRATIDQSARTVMAFVPEARAAAAVVRPRPDSLPRVGATPSVTPSSASHHWVATRMTPFVTWPIVVSAIYVAGVVFLIAQIVIGWMIAHRLDRESTVVSDAATLGRFQRHARRIGLATCPRLVESSGVLIPLTMGVVHPVVLLPADWRTWSDEKIDAAFAHELAHVVRRDALMQRCSLVYRSVFWFSPFSWWLHRHLIDLSDEASDDMVLAGGVDRIAYAEMLVEFFAAIPSASRRASWHVAMASGASAERRVERILLWSRARSARLTKASVFTLLLVAAPVLVLATSSRVVLLREKPSVKLSSVPVAHETPAANEPPTARELPAASTTSASEEIAAKRIVPVANVPAPAALADMALAPPQTEVTSTSAPPYAGGQLLRAVAGDQKIALVFDLPELPGDDVKSAVDAVLLYLRAMDRRMQVGLDRFHLFSVATFDASLETIQDFTWDPQKIREALAKVVAMPRDRAGSGYYYRNVGAFYQDLRLRTMTDLCNRLDDLKPNESDFEGMRVPVRMLEISNTKAVIYVGNGVLRGIQAPFDLTVLQRACRTATVSFYTLDMNLWPPPPPHAGEPGGPPVGLTVSLIGHTPGSPVTFASWTPGLDAGYASVHIRNDSNKPIRSVTLAALVHPTDPSLPTPQVFAREGPSAVIQPGDLLQIESNLIDSYTLNRLAQKGATIEVGVMGVEFSDGSTWTYDLKGKGHWTWFTPN